MSTPTKTSSDPVQVGTGTHWASVAAGQWHTVAVRTDGRLWAWGDNSDGRLGDGSTTARDAPVQVGSATTRLSVTAGSNYTLGLRVEPPPA